MLKVREKIRNKNDCLFLHFQTSAILDQVQEAGKLPNLESFLLKTKSLIEHYYKNSYNEDLESQDMSCFSQDVLEEMEDDLTRELVKVGRFHDGDQMNASSEQVKVQETPTVVQEEVSQKKRAFPTCPKCGKKLKDLNRHLIAVHGVKDRKEAKRVREASGKPKKDKRPVKICPVCEKPVYRLDKHLPSVHADQYPKGSSQLAEAKREAKKKFKTSTSCMSTGEDFIPPQQPEPSKELLDEVLSKQSNSCDDPKPEERQCVMEKLEELEARNQNNTLNDQTNYGLQLLGEVIIEASDDGTRQKSSQQSGDQELAKSNKPGAEISDHIHDIDHEEEEKEKEERKEERVIVDQELTIVGNPSTSIEDEEDEYEIVSDEYEEGLPKPSKPWCASGDREDYFENCLAQFWRHLRRPEGGLKQTENDADYVTNQVYRMIAVLNAGKRCNNFDVLRDSDKVWDNFIGCKEGLPGTLKVQTKYCYMLSIEKFLNFLLNGKSKIELTVEEEKELRATLFSIPGWKSSLKPILRKERAEKKTDKYNSRLLLKEVHDMLQSEPAQEDKALIMNATESSLLSIKEHTRARDYLIFMVIHSNAQRSGIGKGMLVSEFEYAEWREESKRYVILVRDHKNSVDGPAPVIVDKELYQMMKKYYTIFRPIAVAESGGKESPSFFLTRTGQQVSSTSVSKIFNAVGKKYGRVNKGRLYPTKFRQTAVTSFSREGQEKRDDLAKLMTHRESTARTSYLLEDTIERSITAQKELTKKFTPDEKGIENELEEKDDDLEPQLPENILDSQEKVAQWEIQSVSTNTIPPTDFSGNSSNPRRIWSKDSEVILRRVYGHLLKRGRGYPKTAEIHERIKHSKDEDFQMLVLSLGVKAKSIILAKCKSIYKGCNKKKD